MWLEGYLPEKMRPDKCGCIFTLTGSFNYGGASVELYLVEQSYDAAWLGKKVKPLLDHLVHKGFVFVVIQSCSLRLLYDSTIYPLLEPAAVCAEIESNRDVDAMKAAGVLPAEASATTYEQALADYRDRTVRR
jgi:hypothetical protein